MTRIREAMWLLGRRDSISWPVFWASLIAGTIGNFATNSQGLSLGLRLAALFIGQAVLWAVLIAVRATCFRDSERSRPVVVLVAFTAAILARVLAVAWLIAEVHGSQAALLGERIIGAFLNIAPVMVATALGTSALRFRRSQIAELLRTQSELQVALSRVQHQIELRESDATRQVQELLVAQVRGLDLGDPVTSMKQLQSLARDVIRPLSHRYSGEFTGDQQESPPSPGIRVSWADMLDVDVVGRPFRPWLTGLIVLLQALGAILGVQGMPVKLLVMPAFVVIMLSIANRVFEPLLQRRSRRQRVAVILVALLGMSVLAGILVLVLIGTSPPGPVLAIAAVFSTLLSLLLTVVLITIGARSRVATQLEEATQQLQRLLAQQRQAQWCAERSLGRALHGPLQNSVLAAAARLEATLASDEDPAQLLDHLREDLMQQVKGLGVSSSGQQGFDTALARLQATWQGVCDIQVRRNLPGDLASRFNPIAFACLQDIVIEFVSNSVRHSGATIVTIDLAQETSAYGPDIHVRATSNAGLSRGVGAEGMGTRMHDEWATSWSLSTRSDSVELLLVLPA